MSQVRDLVRRYWFHLLVAVLAIAAVLEVVLGRGSPGAPDATLWFCVPAIATLVLPVFACRRFPFAGPAAYWLLAAGDFGRRPAADPVRQGRGLCRTRARRAG